MDALSIWIRRQLLSVTKNTDDNVEDEVDEEARSTSTVNPRDQLLHTHRRRRQDRPFRRTSVQLALPDVAVS
ncbi:hypothetical protein LRAMOSA09070 [Lichtheimia ramosa]|uniref:Uncharacterized protein n=1 Tax=Lichtheimia ramosa TaxID=688394 RepID=A0A077WIW9_9FUNG|nr:hypothetical protein LRAMOSA09070 [Lichtheimia ramosa]